MCGSGIIELVAELFLAGVLTSDGVIDGCSHERTPRVVADGRTFSTWSTIPAARASS